MEDWVDNEIRIKALEIAEKTMTWIDEGEGIDDKILVVAKKYEKYIRKGE